MIDLTCQAPSTLHKRNLKTQQSPVSLDLCLRKTWLGKLHDYRDVIVFENFLLSTPERKAGVFKFLRFGQRFEKLRFRDGLVWTVSLTVEIKLRFQISPA